MSGEYAPLFSTNRSRRTFRTQSKEGGSNVAQWVLIVLAVAMGAVGLILGSLSTARLDNGFSTKGPIYVDKCVVANNSRFDDDFMYGVGNAAYQVEEEDTNTDWSAFTASTPLESSGISNLF